jgi:hypothetical protein
MLYIYLQKRNNQEIKIISIINTAAKIPAKKINDLTKLDLKTKYVSNIKEVIEKHKLDWEVWLESAENYTELKANLLKRGVYAPSSSNAPLHNIPLEENMPDAALLKLKKGNAMTRRMC